jgi:hypothetical protein
VKPHRAAISSPLVAACGRLRFAANPLRIKCCVHHRAIYIAVWISMVALTFASALAGASPAQTRSAVAHAQPAGIPLNTIIIFGDQYNGGDELYDVRITVEQVVRGEKAWQLVRNAGDSNKPPSPGFEYLLARVRFEFAARTNSEHYSYTLDPAQFTAMSADDKPYASPALAEPPGPPLRATLHSGDSAKGWVEFLVPRGDHTPLMLFREDVGNLSHQGSGSIFKLYYDNSYENSPVPGKAKSC